jgi:hypothetical protein
METKHFAFLLHYPSKDKCLLWPGYYEDNKEEIDKGFVETDNRLEKQIGFHSFLTEKQPYKVFVKKTKRKEII